MRNSKKVITVAAFVALFALPLLAGKPSRDLQAPDVPVVSTVYDSGGGVLFKIQSDGNGPYMNSSRISSIIQGAWGDWVLDTTLNANSGRTIRFDLSEPATGSSSMGSFTGTRFIAQCHLNNVDLRTMTAGQTSQCNLVASGLTSDGVNVYRLAQNPPLQPGTSWMNVTCEADGANGCQQWLIVPADQTLTDTDPNFKNIGRLIKLGDGTKRNPDTKIGDFYVSFAIRLNRQ